jgi:hypothetical protein
MKSTSRSLTWNKASTGRPAPPVAIDNMLGAADLGNIVEAVAADGWAQSVCKQTNNLIANQAHSKCMGLTPFPGARSACTEQVITLGMPDLPTSKMNADLDQCLGTILIMFRSQVSHSVLRWNALGVNN